MGSNRSITYITDICSRKELRIFKIWILWFGSKCRVSRCTQQSWLFPRPFALSNFSRSSGFMLCRIERAHLLILLEDFLPQSRNPCEPLSPSFIYIYLFPMSLAGSACDIFFFFLIPFPGSQTDTPASKLISEFLSALRNSTQHTSIAEFYYHHTITYLKCFPL